MPNLIIIYYTYSIIRQTIAGSSFKTFQAVRSFKMESFSNKVVTIFMHYHMKDLQK